MEDLTRVKRVKLDTLIIYPDQTQRTSKTELFRDFSTNRVLPPPPPPHELPVEVQPPTIEDEFTTHQRRTLQDTLYWEQSREALIRAHFESQFPTTGETCTHCNALLHEDHVRCSDCNRHTFFCSFECLSISHNGKQLALHKPQVWKSAENRYHTLNMDVRLDRTDHHCGNGQHSRSGIQVFDPQGRIHTVNITVCSCEKHSVTFMRHQIWASSVQSPSVGFHVELLKWMEYLMLEARVSMLGICQSIRWKNNLSAHEFNTLYRGIIGEAFEQFRHFRYKIRTMEIVSPTLTDDVTCPACPRESGSVFVSLDANFGLVRKSNSGSSCLNPKHAGKIFVDTSTNELISTSKDNKIDKDTVCSNFQAGNNLRSKNKAAKLDVTGVFGSSCRHGVPHTFINLDRGERLCYAIHVIDKLIEELSGSDLKLHILYDIACLLDRHLRVKGISDKYESVAFAVPIFHAYGHKASCQVKYSTRWLPGFGLTDGEEMERIWAYLRRFSFITKEMTPSHRIDLLTDGLLHYKHKKVKELDLTLAKNMEKAQYVISGTHADLVAACQDLSISISKIDEWIQEDKDDFTRTSATEEPVSNEEKYVQVLLSIDNVIDTFSLCDQLEAQNNLQAQHTRLNREAEKMEQQLRIRTRWQKRDVKYKRCKTSLEVRKKKYLLGKLHKQAMEYMFIHNLKKKYSDGQAIAKRLSKTLQRVSKGIRKSLTEYNDAAFCQKSGGLPDTITWTDAANPCANIYAKIHNNREDANGDNTIPTSERERLTDLRNRHSRATEEIELTKKEMMSTLSYLADEYATLINVIRNNADICMGMIICLQEKAEDTRKAYIRADAIFSKYFTTPTMPDFLTNPTDVQLNISEFEEELDVSEMEEDEEIHST